MEGEAHDRANAIGRTWIEKVELATEEPGTPSTNIGPVSELARTMLGPALRTDESFQETAREAMEELSKVLPPEARHILGDSEEKRAQRLDTLIAEGCEAVLAHLHGNSHREE